MMDFILELYKNDNFTIYLTIALVVLVVLFVIVLIFGKRDQKLEETKRLQKIEMDSFKEEKVEPTKVEVTEEVKKEEPVKEDKGVNEEVHVTTFEPSAPQVDEDKTEVIEMPKTISEVKPLLSDSEDSKPISMEELPELKFDEKALENDLNELENIKKKFDEINIPEVKPKEDANINPKVFSSVFVPEKKDANIFAMDDDEDTIELPTLKSMEKPKEEPVKEEAPLLSEDNSSFNFDSVEGETYNLK